MVIHCYYLALQDSLHSFFPKQYLLVFCLHLALYTSVLILNDTHLVMLLLNDLLQLCLLIKLLMFLFHTLFREPFYQYSCFVLVGLCSNFKCTITFSKHITWIFEFFKGVYRITSHFDICPGEKALFKILKCCLISTAPRYLPRLVLLSRGWCCSLTSVSIAPSGTSRNKARWEDILLYNSPTLALVYKKIYQWIIRNNCKCLWICKKVCTQYLIHN